MAELRESTDYALGYADGYRAGYTASNEDWKKATASVAARQQLDKCIKCGRLGISRTWHETRDRYMSGCSPEERRRNDWPADVEHLHYRCRDCGYTWAMPVSQLSPRWAGTEWQNPPKFSTEASADGT